jgi:ornithine cyclodeaminase/alanine dehydrogenase-like protein (mu-crystallin family)
MKAITQPEIDLKLASNGVERGSTFLYLSKQDVIDVGLSTREVIELVSRVLNEHGHKRCEMPAKIGVHPVDGSLMHAMPAWVPGFQTSGVKWIACFPDNHKLGLPQTSGLLILNCPDTGWPICVLDATWITSKRTPAVTALACELLSRKDTEVAGLIGAGIQGREHVLMLPEVLPNLKRIKIYDRRESTRKSLIHDLQPDVPMVELLESGSVEEAVRGSTVVISATAILAKPQPEVCDEWVEPGALIVPIDFDTFWETKTFSRADKFLVDSVNDINHLRSTGRFAEGLPPIAAELGEVIAGIKSGRDTDEQLIVDMNVGMAIEDMAVAGELLRRACSMGVGRILPL